MKATVFFIIIILAGGLPIVHRSRIKARFQHVINGDTIAISYKGKNEKARLIGIDAPERKAGEKDLRYTKKIGMSIEHSNTIGARAIEYIGELIKKNDKVYLEFDAVERDLEGRMLCYVFLKDGRMLNEIMARAGLAYAMFVPPNVKYYERLADAFRQAYNEKIGLWEID